MNTTKATDWLMMFFLGYIDEDSMIVNKISEFIEDEKYDLVKDIIAILNPSLDYNPVDILCRISQSKKKADVKLQMLTKYILETTNADIREKRYKCIRLAIDNRNMLLISTYIDYLRNRYNQKSDLNDSIYMLTLYTNTKHQFFNIEDSEYKEFEKIVEYLELNRSFVNKKLQR